VSSESRLWRVCDRPWWVVPEALRLVSTCGWSRYRRRGCHGTGDVPTEGECGRCSGGRPKLVVEVCELFAYRTGARTRGRGDEAGPDRRRSHRRRAGVRDAVGLGLHRQPLCRATTATGYALIVGSGRRSARAHDHKLPRVGPGSTDFLGAAPAIHVLPTQVERDQSSHRQMRKTAKRSSAVRTFMNSSRPRYVATRMIGTRPPALRVAAGGFLASASIRRPTAPAAGHHRYEVGHTRTSRARNDGSTDSRRARWLQASRLSADPEGRRVAPDDRDRRLNDTDDLPQAREPTPAGHGEGVPAGARGPGRTIAVTGSSNDARRQLRPQNGSTDHRRPRACSRLPRSRQYRVCAT